MLPELGMTTNDFNYGQTIFLLSFLCAELPSGLVSKKLGPDLYVHILSFFGLLLWRKLAKKCHSWIPFIIVAWSVISAAQAALTSQTGYYICRCLIGLLMGGFIVSRPCAIFISHVYKQEAMLTNVPNSRTRFSI
jgi:hypothetical protein